MKRLFSVLALLLLVTTVGCVTAPTIDLRKGSLFEQEGLPETSRFYAKNPKPVLSASSPAGVATPLAAAIKSPELLRWQANELTSIESDHDTMLKTCKPIFEYYEEKASGYRSGTIFLATVGTISGLLVPVLSEASAIIIGSLGVASGAINTIQAAMKSSGMTSDALIQERDKFKKEFDDAMVEFDNATSVEAKTTALRKATRLCMTSGLKIPDRTKLVDPPTE